MTDNAHAAQRLRAAIAGRGTVEKADLLAVLDEHAALADAEPRPAAIITCDHILSRDDHERIRTEIRSGTFRKGKGTLSDRLERIADRLFVAASKIQTTRATTYEALITQILALRVEADQARAAETKATSS